MSGMGGEDLARGHANRGDLRGLSLCASKATARVADKQCDGARDSVPGHDSDERVKRVAESQCVPAMAAPRSCGASAITPTMSTGAERRSIALRMPMVKMAGMSAPQRLGSQMLSNSCAVVRSPRGRRRIHEMADGAYPNRLLTDRTLRGEDLSARQQRPGRRCPCAREEVNGLLPNRFECECRLNLVGLSLAEAKLFAKSLVIRAAIMFGSLLHENSSGSRHRLGLGRRQTARTRAKLKPLSDLIRRKRR